MPTHTEMPLQRRYMDAIPAQQFEDRGAALPRPSVILKAGFTCTFGKCEIETAAEYLVRFLAERKGDTWAWFTLAELIDFYRQENLEQNRLLFGLMGMWFDD